MHDCPHCEAVGSVEPAGYIVLADEIPPLGIIQARRYYCSCCARYSYRSESGKRIVEQDVNGVIIDGP
jgi:hypothetical protein